MADRSVPFGAAATRGPWSGARATSAWAIVVALLIAFFAWPAEAHAERRVALVIGQSKYVNVAPLDNPASDARLVAATLRKLDFEIVGDGAMLDLDKAHFDAALKTFSDQVQGADVGLFYYAGHGVQVDGENFLAPTDANPKKPADIYLQMVSAGVILKQLEGAGTKLNIVLFDACRNDPFGGLHTRGGSRGLAQMQAPEGTLVSYATQPGNVAMDGAHGDSPYTLALVDVIQKPGLGLFEAFNQVGLEVKRTTGGVQQPWLSSSPIEGGFYFAGSAPSDAKVASTDAELPGQTMRATSSATDVGSGSRDAKVASIETGAPAEANPANPSPSDASADPVGDCDRLAGNPQDGQLPRGVPGVDFEEIDAEKAIPACRSAVALRPTDARLMFELSRSLQKAGDDEQTVQWLRKSAAAGNLAAMANLGSFYQNGKVVTRDYAVAMAWFRRAAMGGNTTAMHRIGMLYGRGLGVAADPAQAYGWFLKSAQGGDPLGMLPTARALADGDGVAKNPQEALSWNRKAADAGNRVGMTRVGIALARGEGAPRNPAEAAVWFQKAAALGDKEAMFKLAEAYEAGNGIAKDPVLAKQWRQRAKE